MASFTDLDTLRQMGLVSLIYNGNHQLCLKFSCTGTGITFNGSMDSALIIAAIKQQMTVDNIGLHGMIGPMGGMMTEYVPLALPTVSISGDFNDQNNKFSFANSHIDYTVGPNGTCIMYEWGTKQYKEYDTTKSYAVWSYSLLNGSLVGRTGFSVEPLTSGGKTIIQCLNSTSEKITASYCFIAVCSSPNAHVITVYDSSNNPYNAFQYTSDGTDYYYVLDGTQTDWTDDLASIGYSDQLLIRGWMKADKSSVTLNAGGWTNWQLLNDSGSILYVDTSKTYTLHSPKSGTMKINKSVSGELYYEGKPSETITVSDVIISVS